MSIWLPMAKTKTRTPRWRKGSTAFSTGTASKSALCLPSVRMIRTLGRLGRTPPLGENSPLAATPNALSNRVPPAENGILSTSSWKLRRSKRSPNFTSMFALLLNEMRPRWDLVSPTSKVAATFLMTSFSFSKSFSVMLSDASTRKAISAISEQPSY